MCHDPFSLTAFLWLPYLLATTGIPRHNIVHCSLKSSDLLWIPFMYNFPKSPACLYTCPPILRQNHANAELVYFYFFQFIVLNPYAFFSRNPRQKKCDSNALKNVLLLSLLMYLLYICVLLEGFMSFFFLDVLWCHLFLCTVCIVTDIVYKLCN